MSLLGQLAKDFSSFMTQDWGKKTKIKHLVSQTFSATSGDFADTEIEIEKDIIFETISKKDIEAYPNLVRETDRVGRVDSSEMLILPTKGDIVEVDNEQYQVIEIANTLDIIKMFLRKH